MTYDTKDKILHIGVYEKVKLTNLENKLLICLSSGNVATYEDMTKYLKVSKCKLKQLKGRIMRKGLRVETARGVGFKLADEVYFK